MKRKSLSLLLAVGMSLILLPLLFFTMAKTQSVAAATFVVDTLVDESDGECTIDCSLRDAIFSAAGGDTINIPAGTYALSDTLGQLTVNKTLTFAGTGGTPADVIIEAGQDARIFTVSTGTATFQNLTLQGGHVVAGNGSGGAINADGLASLILNTVVITNNRAITNGGAIAITSGSLSLTNSQIMSNTAGNNGGGIYANNGPVVMDTTDILTNTAVNNGGGISLLLANATLVMNSGTVSGNQANATLNFPGGGIHVAQGTVTINDGTISNNHAHRGGGILTTSGKIILNGGQISSNQADYGGGVYVRNANALLTINGGVISQNQSLDPNDFGGGALYIFQGQAIMNGGEISQNTALNHGGAMEVAEGGFTLNDGIIAENSAGNMGGAIFNDRGTLTINGGTIHTNNSTGAGGAISVGLDGQATLQNSALLTNTTAVAQFGGAIHNSGTLTMTNVTLSGNGAGSGGGVYNVGTAVLTNVTLSENGATINGAGLFNGAGTLTLGNSIVYGNTGGDCQGTITTAGNNITGCGLSGSGDSGSDPLLEPLALNDGSTLNYALGDGSPARDGGSNILCPTADQRGNLRPIDGDGDNTSTCDVGSYEHGLGFFISDASLTEGNSGSVQMSFMVSRSFMTSTTTTVEYATVDDTALAGADYTAVPSTTLTFLPATMTQTVTVDILGDTLDEIDEQFTVMLGNASAGVQVGDFSGAGTILDDDAEPSLTVADTMVLEGDSGTITAFFTATLSAASGKTITVDFETMDGTAEANGDYLSASGTLTFTPGDTEEVVAITVNGELLDEADSETFSVELSNASNVTLADGSAQGTILDDDPLPTLSIADTSVSEGNSGSKTASFVVSLDAPSGRTVTVTYATSAGTASTGTDYVATSGSLTFTPGDTQETVSVTLNGDTIDEANETFLVTLSAPTNATLSDNQATGTITDDDAAPTASINDVTVTEGDSGTVTAVFTVTLSAASEKVITLTYSSSNGTAVAGEDFTAVPSTVLTFNPGDPLSQTISVTVQGDEDTEPDEQFFINLSGANNVTLSDSQGIGTIQDDDGYFLYLPLIVKP